jgi:hypothetical protein
MDASFMSLERHERGIHALRLDAGDARVAKVRSGLGVLPYRSTTLSSNKLSGGRPPWRVPDDTA